MILWRTWAFSSICVIQPSKSKTANDLRCYTWLKIDAPWCGHCKALEPEYKKAAEQLASYEPNVIIAKVDATEEKKAASDFGVEGFPTLKWFVNGKPNEYTGGRTADTIVSWIKKKTGPSTKTLATVADVTSFKVCRPSRLDVQNDEPSIG